MFWKPYGPLSTKSSGNIKYFGSHSFKMAAINKMAAHFNKDYQNLVICYDENSKITCWTVLVRFRLTKTVEKLNGRQTEQNFSKIYVKILSVPTIPIHNDVN